ncbi:MAG: DoxX protein [bacterium]
MFTTTHWIIVAHAKWFIDPSQFPLQIDTAAIERTVLAGGVALAAIGLAFLADRFLRRRSGRRRPAPLPSTRRDLSNLISWLLLILALHVSVPLVVAGVQRQLFVPNLAMPWTFVGGLVGLTQIVIALSFAYGVLTRAAALVLAGLFPVGAVIFGPVDMLEQLHILGIAFFTAILGRGAFSFDGILALPRPRFRTWVPSAVPVLRVLAGVGMVWAGFTEKLWNVPLAVAFLDRYPFNFMPALGFTGFTNADFAVAAGIAEVTIGALIASGFLTRLVILAAWVPFNFTLPYLGWVELVGHLPIYGIMAVLLLWGGHEATRFLQEIERKTP